MLTCQIHYKFQFQLLGYINILQSVKYNRIMKIKSMMMMMRKVTYGMYMAE
jgi:hypothetical protein